MPIRSLILGAAVAAAGAMADGGTVPRTEFPVGLIPKPDPSYERANALPLAPELSFALEGTPTFDHGALVAHGILRNSSDHEVPVILFPSGNGVALHIEPRVGPGFEFWRGDDPERPKDLPIRPPPAPPP